MIQNTRVFRSRPYSANSVLNNEVCQICHQFHWFLMFSIYSVFHNIEKISISERFSFA